MIKQKYEYTLEDIANDLGYDTWENIYKEWKNIPPTEKRKIQEVFTKGISDFVLKNKRLIRDNIWKAIDVSKETMAMEGVEEGFNEIVISDFEIVKIVDIDKFKK